MEVAFGKLVGSARWARVSWESVFAVRTLQRSEFYGWIGIGLAWILLLSRIGFGIRVRCSVTFRSLGDSLSATKCAGVCKRNPSIQAVYFT